jgi:hypothetical protein
LHCTYPFAPLTGCESSYSTFGVSASSDSLVNSELIEQRMKSIGRNPYGEAGLYRDGATALFDPLSAIGKIRLMINLPDVPES